MFSSRVLGSSIANQITKRATAPLLVVGSDRISRHAFSAVDFYSPNAAANLSRAIEQFKVRNLRDVFDKVPPESLLVPGLGAWSIAALGAAFELAKIGGDSPLETWFQKHAEKGEPIVTVHTLKEHQKATPATRRRRRQKEIERETRAKRSNGTSATTTKG